MFLFVELFLSVEVPDVELLQVSQDLQQLAFLQHPKQTVSGNNIAGKGEVVKTGEETFVFAGIAGLVILSGCGF